jgi:hypothetical protein
MTVFRTQMFYPVEGDSAICEIVYGDEIWADLALENIDLAAVGPTRVANARVMLATFAPAPESTRKFQTVPLDAALVAIEEAKQRLIANEVGRAPGPGDNSTP